MVSIISGICAAGWGAPNRKPCTSVQPSTTRSAKLFGGLHAFAGGRQAEAGADADGRLDDRETDLLGRHVLNQRLVDLDLVELDRAQIAEAGIAGAEVVERNANADLPEFGEHRQNLGIAADQHRFGDLQFEALRREPGRHRARR